MPPVGRTRRSRSRRCRISAAVPGVARRPALGPSAALALLLGTAALYLADLSRSGTANEFYAAAVKSGTESLKAWLFGSLDSANAITVDKPPASLWLMVLSARIFGFSSFSMLLPQALLGVGTVGLAVRRRTPLVRPGGRLIAGALLALTPVAALMFRFDNPDAMLVFLMTLARVRAWSGPSTPPGCRTCARPPYGAALDGAGRRGHRLRLPDQDGPGLLVLPAFGLVYLVASPLRLRARIGHLLAAAGALVVSAGWFIALVELWPAASRPYIGGSTNNSLWELALGYNGLGRLLGGSGNGGGGGGGGTPASAAPPGLAAAVQHRLRHPDLLVPARRRCSRWSPAWCSPGARRGPTRTRARADPLGRLAGRLAWLVFSFMSGTIHPYYSVALAPAIAALVGDRRHRAVGAGATTTWPAAPWRS